jgi:type IV pilus assembly protein PilE
MTITSDRHRHYRAFTLIELLIALVIVAIISSFALPAWRGYIIATRRIDATGTLLHIAARQQQFRLQHRRYAGTEELHPPPPAGLGISGTPDGHYRLSVATTAAGFIATAQVHDAGNQHDDATCATFSLDDVGMRTATSLAGHDTTDECWRR